MKKILLNSILPSILLLVSACTGQASTPIVSPPANQYTLTDPAVPLEISNGSEFYIAVPSNPSTGYHWQVMNDWDPKVFVTRGTLYQSTSPEGIVGGGGMDIFLFQAVGTGEAVFTIGYFPPANTDTPEQTLTFTVQVK